MLGKAEGKKKSPALLRAGEVLVFGLIFEVYIPRADIASSTVRNEV